MNYRAVPASLVHLSRKSLRLGYVPRYPAPAIMAPLTLPWVPEGAIRVRTPLPS